MKNKKLVAIFMSVLLFVIAPTAFAVEGDPIAEANLEFAVMTLEDIPVQVTVPAEKKLFINPLGFPVNMGGYTDNSQIIMEPAYIENLGDTPLNVTVEILGSLTEGSAMTFASSPTKGTATTGKKAFLYFEIQAVSDPDHVTWANEYDIEKHIPVRYVVKKRKNIIELDAADGVKCYGAFRLAGDCVAKPRVPWTTADGVQVVVAFTFQPVISIN